MSWFYWMVTKWIYKVFYKDEVFNLAVRDEICERGDRLEISGRNTVVVLGLKDDKSFFTYKVIREPHFITKRQFYDYFVLTLFVISQLLAYIFIFLL